MENFWNDVGLEARACREASVWPAARWWPSHPTSSSQRCLRGTISYRNSFPLENFIQSFLVLVHSKSYGSVSRNVKKHWGCGLLKVTQISVSKYMRNFYPGGCPSLSHLSVVWSSMTALPSPFSSPWNRGSSRFVFPILTERAGLACVFPGVSTAQSLNSLGAVQI